MFILASGYVIRILWGCILLDVPPSNWLLLCASTLALLLALGKRRGSPLDVGELPLRSGEISDRPSVDPL